MATLHVFTLSISPPQLEHRFWSSHDAISFRRSIDLAGLASSAVMIASMGGYHLTRKGPVLQHIILAVLALAQLFGLTRRPRFYNRHRTAIQLMQRLLRFAPPLTVGRWYSGMFAYLTQNHTSSSWKSLLGLWLADPLLVAVAALNYSLPYKLSCAVAAVKLALDLSFMVPTAACIQDAIGFESKAAPVCQRLESLLAALFFPSPPSADCSACAGGAALLLLPALSYIMLGALAPLLVIWWTELRQKQHYVRKCWPALELRLTPVHGASMTGVGLAFGYTLLGLCYLIAAVVAERHMAALPAYCSVLLGRGA